MWIETERLIISAFDTGMAESVQMNSLDEDNRRFVPDEVFETLGEATEALDYLIGRYKSESGPFVYPVLLKDETVIGHVQAVQLGDEWEIGYHIVEKYTGRGYATEAVRAFLPVIMKQLDISVIYGISHAGNTASQKVLEKCEFVLEFSGPDHYQGSVTEICRYRYDR